MHANNLFVNYSTYWQTVKTVSESFPKFNIVSPLAFIVKPIYSVNLTAFVVTSEEKEVLGILNLVGK